MSDEEEVRRAAVLTAKGSGIPVGAEMEVGNDGEEMHDSMAHNEDMDAQEERLHQLYDQVPEEADERDRKMREYTDELFKGLKNFIGESLKPKDETVSVTTSPSPSTSSHLSTSAVPAASSPELSEKQKLFLSAYPEKVSTSAEIEPLIATHMCDDWQSAMDKDEEQKCLDMFLPPKNCERMVVPRVDEHIWMRLDEKQRTEDRYLENLERLVLQSQFALQPALHYFLKKEGAEEDKLLSSLQQSAKISSLLNKKLVARRRILLRPHLEEKYQSLAKKDLPITEHLFGEDLDKKVEALDKTKDIVEKARKMKGKTTRFSRNAQSVPGYQRHINRFQRALDDANNVRTSQPFLGGNGGRKDRQFNQPPRKPSNPLNASRGFSHSIGKSQSRFSKSYNK